MPTYEYECNKCCHHFEVFQAMSDEPVKKCPKCGKQVRRLIFGGAGVIFKGSGFYITDKTSNNGNASCKKHSESQIKSGDKSCESTSNISAKNCNSAGESNSGNSDGSPCSTCPKAKSA